MDDESVLPALPYIDPPRSNELQRQVRMMVEEEMKTFEPMDYLAHRPELAEPETTLLDSVMVKEEFKRIEEGQTLKLNSIDLSRLKVLGPSQQQLRVLPAWRSGVENVQARLIEHSEKNLTLELGKTYGQAAWKAHAEELRKAQDWITQKVDTIKSKKDDINRKRKYQQTTKKNDLEQMEEEWWETVRRNNDAELACELAERKAKRMRREAKRRGLLQR